MIRVLVVLAATLLVVACAAAEEQPYRPEAGQFPALDKAYAYRGEIVFVDHANRRGSIRVQGSGMFFRNDPHPFAMLPYGMVRYHGAPADLRDIPLGTVMHVLAFLPPDPKNSAVPVLPVNNRDNDANNNRGAGIFPAENHVLLLEDEPSHCQREGMVWKLKEVTLKNNEGMIVASCEAKTGSAGFAGKVTDEKLTFDAATSVWRGHECLSIADLTADGTWPAEGTKSLENQTGHCCSAFAGNRRRMAFFTRFHISDIRWLDDAAIWQRAAQHQNDAHKAFIRAAVGCPHGSTAAWSSMGKFSRACITATLFGGMDADLYADLKKDSEAMINAAENTLKHTHGAYGPNHMASRGSIKDVKKTDGTIPLGSSGIQIRFETDLIIEGIRPGRIVRVHSNAWPMVEVPREEYLNDANSIEERFPTSAIFPRY